ncbi:MAG: glutathione S-transferase [Betaproteobacteria bacterium]|nr:glutathione S-transferase [Betaproteobacteria bacterium]
MIVIWGRDNSVNVQKPLWLCEEVGLPCDRREAGGAFGVVDTPEYRALNPNGLVPTMVDDGFVLWESNAIVRYLAAVHSEGDLWPLEPRIRAEADRWMDWQNTTLWPALRPLFWNLVRTPEADRDAREIAASHALSGQVLGVLDTHLGDRAFVAGDRFTMGDIPVGCAVWRWLALPIERVALPNLERWFAALAARPAFKRVVMKPLT